MFTLIINVIIVNTLKHIFDLFILTFNKLPAVHANVYSIRLFERFFSWEKL